jgi:hypothetical protein
MVGREHVLDSCETDRADTIGAVEELFAPEFGYRAAPGVMAFGEIARHIRPRQHPRRDGKTGREPQKPAGRPARELQKRLSIV